MKREENMKVVIRQMYINETITLLVGEYSICYVANATENHHSTISRMVRRRNETGSYSQKPGQELGHKRRSAEKSEHVLRETIRIRLLMTGREFYSQDHTRLSLRSPDRREDVWRDPGEKFARCKYISKSPIFCSCKIMRVITNSGYGLSVDILTANRPDLNLIEHFLDEKKTVKSRM